MKLIANALLKILVLCILPMPAVRPNIGSWQYRIENLLALKDFIRNKNLSDFSEDDEQNSNDSTFRNFSHPNISEGCIDNFVDLDADDDCNQTVEHASNMPEFRPKKRKHSSEFIEENTQSQPRVKRRKIREDIQLNYSKEDKISRIAEFNHRSSNLFLLSKNNFEIKKYRSKFKFNDSVFIKEFYSIKQLQRINPDVFLRPDKIVERNFEELEVYAKRVVAEYVEVYKHESEDRCKYDNNSYRTMNKTLDPARTKGFYYLLIYSLYETGLIGIPRRMAAVEKILLNIITHARLMAYMHNCKIKEEIQPKKLNRSRIVLSTMSRSKQTNYSQTNFCYTDFTKALRGKSFKKYDLFSKNADLMKKEINANIQLIIDKEFSDNLGYKKMCEDYNSKALKFNRSILFERFPFKVGKHAVDNYLYEDLDNDSVIYVTGYPRNILSRLMDTDTKNQIKELPDINLKSVFILIFISKLCLCNVTDLCTLPEYLILIGSLQEAYHKHKAGQDKSIANFQSLLSYLFSLHYLDKEQVEKKREESRKIIENVFPEYNEIFPNFNSEIDNLKDE